MVRNLTELENGRVNGSLNRQLAPYVNTVYVNETPASGSADGGIVDSSRAELPLDGEAHRDTGGRFQRGAKPGPGRPKGCRNYKTLQAIELRQRIVDSWDRVNGDRLLDQLAKSDPAEYLRLVFKLLPAPGVQSPQNTQPTIRIVSGIDLDAVLGSNLEPGGLS